MNDSIRDILIDILDVADMPDELQDELIEKVGENIFQTMIVHALTSLGGKDRDTLITYLDKDEDMPVFFEFLEQKVPDIGTVVARAAAAYAMV